MYYTDPYFLYFPQFDDPLSEDPLSEDPLSEDPLKGVVQRLRELVFELAMELGQEEKMNALSLLTEPEYGGPHD